MTPRAESTAPDHRAAAAWIAANATALPVAATDISATDAPYSPVSIYVEAHWLPIIGPSAFVAWRRLTLMVDWTRVIVDLSELGSELGLTSGCGPNSVIYNGTLICVQRDHEPVGYLNRRYDFPAGRARWVAALPTPDDGVVCATAVEAARRLIDRVQALEIGAAA